MVIVQNPIKIASKKVRPSVKGDFNGECNRGACYRSRAVFYNHSTHKYYCPKCARLINEFNRDDAMRLYGHDLCTYGLQTK